MRMKNFKISSSTLEYAVLILIVAVALVTMSGYIRRALSGKWREVGDTFGFGRQYGGLSGRKYDCRTSHVYSCGGACWINCFPAFFCQPICFSVQGFGLSSNSMQEACSLAVKEAWQQKTVACGNKPVTWCGWHTSQIIWNEDFTKVLSDRVVCPGQP